MTADEIRSQLTDKAQAKAEHDQASTNLGAEMRALVLAGLEQGMKPAELVRLSGWSGAYVRRIARDAGIEPPEEYRGRAERLRSN